MEEINSGSVDPRDIEVEIISVQDIPIKEYVSIGMVLSGSALLISIFVLGIISILRRA